MTSIPVRLWNHPERAVDFHEVGLTLTRAQLRPGARPARSAPPFALLNQLTDTSQHRFVADAAGAMRDYVLVLDNRIEARFPAEVSLRVELSIPKRWPKSARFPRERRRATVALSLLFFGAVVVFSAAKFLRT